MKEEAKKAKQKFFDFKMFITIVVTALVTLVAVEAIMMFTIRQDEKKSTNRQPEASQLKGGADSSDAPEVNKDNVARPSDNPISDAPANGYISTQSALDAALAALGVEQSAVRDVDVDLEYKFGQTYYEVSFEHEQYEYEYYINATDGTVLKSFREVER